MGWYIATYRLGLHVGCLNMLCRYIMWLSCLLCTLNYHNHTAALVKQGEEPDILLQVQIFNNTTPQQVITAVNSTCKAPQDREQSILTERRNASGNQVPSSPTVSAPPPPHTHMYMHIHTHARTDHLQHKVLL